MAMQPCLLRHHAGAVTHLSQALLRDIIQGADVLHTREDKYGQNETPLDAFASRKI